jgi:purine-nucleoside phosphorylase
MTDAITHSAQLLTQRLGPRAPKIAVLLGTGWGPFADAVQDAVDVPYADLPAFPVLGVGGHAGTVRSGRIGQLDVMVLAGRKHAYETGEADGMKGAAGSLDAAMRPGSLMLIADHLNFAQRSPLFGEPGDGRFIDMGNAYDRVLRAQAKAVASAMNTQVYEGVYAWFMGPQFETPAEIRMFRQLGAQAVGMSTVPETILARHAGMRVLALSLMTNMAAGMEAEVLSHAHTMATAKSASERAVAYLTAVLQKLEL